MKKNICFFAIALVVFFICAAMISGLTNNFGKVRVTRAVFSFIDNESTIRKGSYLLMVPEGASKESKTPVIAIAPGINSNAYYVKSYGIEYARRGNTVLLLDIPGSGQTEMYGYKGYAEGLDLIPYLTGIHGQIGGMDWVDQKNVIIAGFSAGRDVATAYAKTFSKDIKTAMHFSAYRAKDSQAIHELGINYFGLVAGSSGLKQAKANYGDGWIGDGDWQKGTALYGFMCSKAVQHVFQPINKEMLEHAMEAGRLSSPTGSTLADNDFVYPFIEIFAMLGFVALIVFVYNLIMILLSLDCFSSIIRKAPTIKYPGYTTLIKNATVAKIVRIALPVLNVLLTCLVVEEFALKHYIIMPFSGVNSWASSFFNGYIPFLICMMFIQTGTFLVYHYLCGKPNGANAESYGLSWGNTKDTVLNMFKCLVIAIIVFVFMQVLSGFLDRNWGVSFNFFAGIVSYCNLPVNTVKQMPLYVIIYIFVFLCLSFGPFIIHKYVDTGDKKKDAIISDVISIVAVAIPFFMLAIWYLLYGMEIIKVSADNVYPTPPWVLMNGMFGYPFILAFIMPLFNRLYRKTNTVWPGVFVSAFISVTFLLSAYCLQTI